MTGHIRYTSPPQAGFLAALALAATAMLLPVAGVAQDFTLFEAVEQSSNNDAGRDTRVTRATREQAGQPVFTLIGTSRIGDQRTAMLAHRDGTTVKVALNASGTTLVPGHAQYQLIDVGPGRVALKFPDSNPCIEFPEHGVACNGSTNIAALNLRLGQAIAEPREAQSEEPESGAENPDNPFARIRAQQAAAGNDSPEPNSQRFQPHRIQPEDVPPGMRVVSTPFGDRLVEE